VIFYSEVVELKGMKAFPVSVLVILKLIVV
jgi:hypothetical protein